MSNPYTSLTLYRWKKNAPDYARLIPEANFVIDNIDDFISRNFDWAYGWAESQAFPRFPELETEIYFDDVCVFNKGTIADARANEALSAVMAQRAFTVRVVLNQGTFADAVYTTDFSYEYVKINGEYTT